MSRWSRLTWFCRLAYCRALRYFDVPILSPSSPSASTPASTSSSIPDQAFTSVLSLCPFLSLSVPSALPSVSSALASLAPTVEPSEYPTLLSDLEALLSTPTVAVVEGPRSEGPKAMKALSDIWSVLRRPDGRRTKAIQRAEKKVLFYLALFRRSTTSLAPPESSTTQTASRESTPWKPALRQVRALRSELEASEAAVETQRQAGKEERQKVLGTSSSRLIVDHDAQVGPKSASPNGNRRPLIKEV